MTNDELVEKVARAIWMADPDPDDPCEDMPFEVARDRHTRLCEARAAIAAMRPAIRAIRAHALEEAAMRVKQIRHDALTNHGDNYGKAGEWMRAALDDAEDAIRALKEIR